jgi:hypothetical protein
MRQPWIKVLRISPEPGLETPIYVKRFLADAASEMEPWNISPNIVRESNTESNMKNTYGSSQSLVGGMIKRVRRGISRELPSH